MRNPLFTEHCFVNERMPVPRRRVWRQNCILVMIAAVEDLARPTKSARGRNRNK
jgi:hypothetical protein